MELILGEQCFIVDAGTAARVIDRSGFISQECQIRVLAGPFAQQRGWVPADWITP